jgi:hypothetical protein
MKIQNFVDVDETSQPRSNKRYKKKKEKKRYKKIINTKATKKKKKKKTLQKFPLEKNIILKKIE